mmetsp:Transcript_13030/g.28137  ORF Transcript_13030/g.28137 Transcript_13030/m.28137 type:complete len:442 (+) Transcript_13030:1606-2931(+)
MIENVPMYVTIMPKHVKFQIPWAREMVEDSILEFLDLNKYSASRKARLLYELAVSLGGVSNIGRAEGGLVRQRSYLTRDMVWMKLLDLPILSAIELVSFDTSVRLRVEKEEIECSVEIFGQGLGGDPKSPFVLVCGKYSEQVAKATKLVADSIVDYQQRVQNNELKGPMLVENPLLSKPLASSRKRVMSPDVAKSGSAERPTKTKRSHEKKEQGKSTELTYILTVPLWVTQKCRNGKELFSHLTGEQNGKQGHKSREIRSKTNCLISFGRSSGNEPMVISIISKEGKKPDVILAKRMIIKSIIEFLDDTYSEGRLIYQMGMTETGSFNLKKTRGAVQVECQLTNLLVWMKLLELPSTIGANGKRMPHGKRHLNENHEWMVGNTDCTIEKYGFDGEVPRRSGPYVLVCGNDSVRVNEVAARVSDVIDRHMRGCRYGCKFYNE